MPAPHPLTKIAYLAWGSLLWKAGPLPLASDWMADGPLLPLEFCRVGDYGELAVALCAGAAPMQSRWAWLDTPDLDSARELLRQREQIDPAHPEWVGSLPAVGGTPYDPLDCPVDAHPRHRRRGVDRAAAALGRRRGPPTQRR